jgi:hypothetical protein
MAHSDYNRWSHGDFNDGRGTAGPERDRGYLDRLIDRDTEVGHWLWKGRVNSWGTPVLPGPEGEVVLAAEVVYHLWLRMVPQAPFTRRCAFKACVNPECFKHPRKRGITKKAD